MCRKELLHMKKQLLGVFAAATALGTGFLSAPSALAFDAGNIATASDLKECLANSGITCKLSDDIVLTSEDVLDVPGTVTLDLNGKKITVASSFQQQKMIAVHNGGELIINDATGEGLISGEGGAIDGEGYMYPFSAVMLTVKNDDPSKVAKLTVNGGTLIGNYYAIVGNGSRRNTEIIINDGTMKGLKENDSAGIYHPQQGKLTVNGGKISGAVGIYMKTGTLNVTGGEIYGNGILKPYAFNANGFEATGDAIVLDNCNYPGGELSSTISGGTINSKNAKAVASYVGNGVEESKLVEPTISGGNFSTEPKDEDIPAGYKKVKNDDGTWTVSKIETPTPKEEEKTPTSPNSGFMLEENFAASGFTIAALLSAALVFLGKKKLAKK